MKTSNKSMSMFALKNHVSELGDKEIVLDVRSREEFAEGHVPGAKNIPHDEIALHAEALKSYDLVYIHCQAGRRAQAAYSELEKLGLKNLVCVSGGGMADWISAGYEVERGA